MPKERPNLSITLPRNFTFHFTEGEEPKTPEDERQPPLPAPPSPKPYRIKRRTRPSRAQLANFTYEPSSDMVPTSHNPSLGRSVFPQDKMQYESLRDHNANLLSPARVRPFKTAPRASSRQFRPSPSYEEEPKTPTNLQLAESIERPMSACSLVSTLSSSSDGSDASFESHLSLSGSCTSPESEADPFMSRTITKTRARVAGTLLEQGKARRKKPHKVLWTAEMDRHLWTTYLKYLQDPTVTPFKLLPGAPPPLGICHRVARDARKTWRSPKIPTRPGVGLLRAGSTLRSVSSAESPETIRPLRSGSNTPTGTDTETFSKLNPWPKGGAASRGRLRYLSKNEPSLAPHYQRMLHSRSPSPCSVSSPPLRLRQIRYATPPNQTDGPSFNTRDFRLSLIGSTAPSMQPEGPLAQLGERRSASEDVEMDFNTPIVPFASEAPIPSDVLSDCQRTASPETVTESIEAISQDHISSPPPALGSPVTFNTWGPSRSRRFNRPITPRLHTDDSVPESSTLKSPIRFHDYDTFPYPNVMKRRAQQELEEEVSPGGSDIRKDMLQHLFGNQPGNSGGRHRRIRSRGFSLGDASLAQIFTPPEEEAFVPDIPRHANVALTTARFENPSNVQINSSNSNPPRLGSPFLGIAPRGSRRPASRHGPSASMSAFENNVFGSIDQSLNQAKF